MKIMTLNVNVFRGRVKEHVPDEVCLDNMRQIKELIDKVIINKNDIIILQEIPHKIFKSGGGWFDNPLYNRFNELFQEYKILKPKYLVNSWKCTVAICREDSLWGILSKNLLHYDTKYSYGNRIVELQCQDVSLLGVHVKPEDGMWDLLLPALKDAPYTYVVGDFNANEKRGDMSGKPKEIRNCGYNNLIPNNIVTCYSYNTPIDNIYINSSFTIDKNVAVKVKDTNLTDHALCILEYDFEYTSL
ncbi:hypothetical protein [Oceanobacillus picturae]|uniref:hypothetical protein n=1 Tax=Oceanobacillus picturae TaxID=171693 RepID=UPI00363BDC62